jgi:hypothetical protein
VHQHRPPPPSLMVSHSSGRRLEVTLDHTNARRDSTMTWRWQRSALCLASMLAAIFAAQYMRQLWRPQPPADAVAAPPCAVVVVGGGLAGLSAAVEAAAFFSSRNLPSCTVTLVDKEPRIGGNSAKASSGINAARTPEQVAAGIADSVDAFAADTAAAGGGLGQPELLRALAEDSVQASIASSALYFLLL